jgi:hypothetical protein
VSNEPAKIAAYCGLGNVIGTLQTMRELLLGHSRRDFFNTTQISAAIHKQILITAPLLTNAAARSLTWHPRIHSHRIESRRGHQVEWTAIGVPRSIAHT